MQRRTALDNQQTSLCLHKNYFLLDVCVIILLSNRDIFLRKTVLYFLGYLHGILVSAEFQ